MSKQWTILEALTWTEQRLERAGERHPRLAAQMLAAHATGLTRIELYTSFDKPLSEGERAVLRESIQRRLACEPLQYIVGRVGFRHLELMVRPPVLIPRPETESLVELVLEWCGQIRETRAPKKRGQEKRAVASQEGGEFSARILDIGTGTGAIALSLLQELQGCTVVATDKAEAALALARENAATLGLDDSSRFTLYRDNVATELLRDPTQRHTFDVVVSNPPYIPTKAYEGLEREILQYESREALDGGADGLDIFRKIATQARKLLKSSGMLAVELHEDTLGEAAEYAQSLGYHKVAIQKDLTGRERFLTAMRPETEED